MSTKTKPRRPAAYTITDTAIGPLFVAACGGKLIAIKFSTDEKRAPEAVEAFERETHGAYALERDDAALRKIAKHLRDYVDGRRKDLDIPFDVSWTNGFRREVLLEVARLPRGSVASYAEIARRCGRPNAYRAVGNTMATNPIPLVIPCHRVVGSDGGLAGFGGGLDVKRRLLALEGATLV